MINFINTKSSPSKLQYTIGNRMFNREIPGNTCCAYEGLTSYGQVVNEDSLIKQGIGIYDQIGNSMLNTGLFQTGWRGTVSQTGLTLTNTTMSNLNTGWTFSTSANTAMALNTISASTLGNNVFINFSGTSVSTTSWLNAINATPFSGWGITVIGASPNVFITPITQSMTLTANIFGGSVTNFALFRTSDRDPYYFSNLSFSASTTFLKLSVF